MAGSRIHEQFAVSKPGVACRLPLADPSDRAWKLLVSVRNAAEATAAIAGGCDVLDVKEPDRGSLGMADRHTLLEVIDVARSCADAGDRGLSTSAALGELIDDSANELVTRVPPGLSFVKVGLSGLGNVVGWVGRLREFKDCVTEGHDRAPRFVAVVYADARAAGAPHPDEIVDAAIELGCAGVLFDTFMKDGATLLDSLPQRDLARLAARARAAGLMVALAGNVGPALLPQLVEVPADIVAVRGAVCRGKNRRSEISAEAVRVFRDELNLVQTRRVELR